MTVDRSIHLDISTPNPGGGALTDTPSRDNTTARAPPDPQAQQRFEAALKNAPLPADPAPALASPFLSARPLQPAKAPRADGAEVTPLIRDCVQRLLVGQDRKGGQQVGLELKDGPLAGVVVTINQDEGRLHCTFTCSQEAPRLRLNAQASDLAASLAQSLQSPVLFTVCSDDREFPCTLEIAVSP